MYKTRLVALLGLFFYSLSTTGSEFLDSLTGFNLLDVPIEYKFEIPTEIPLDLSGKINLNFTPIYSEDGTLISINNISAISSLGVNASVPVIFPIGIEDQYRNGTPVYWNNISVWDNPSLALGNASEFINVVANGLNGNVLGTVNALWEIPESLNNLGPTEHKIGIKVAGIKVFTSTSDSIPLLKSSFSIGTTLKYAPIIHNGANVIMDQSPVLEFLTVKEGGILSGNAGMIVKDTLTNQGLFNDLQGKVYNFANIDNGVANINNNLTLQNGFINLSTVNIDDGNFTFESSTSNAGILNLNSGSLTIKKQLFNSDKFNWFAGNISGGGELINNTNSFYLLGAGNKNISSGTSIINNSITTQADGSDLAFNNFINRYGNESKSMLTNSVGATFDIQGDGDLVNGISTKEVRSCYAGGIIGCSYSNKDYANQGSGEFNNEGLFIKSSGDGESIIESGIAFNNTGTVEVQSGTLTINAANGDGGQYIIKENTALNLNSGSRNNSNYVYADNTVGVIKGNDHNSTYTIGTNSQIEVKGDDHNANYTVGSNSQIDVGTGVNGTANFTGDGTLLINGIQGKSGTDTSLTGDIGEIIITGGLTTQSGGKISLDFDTALLLDGGSIGGSGETINNGELVWKSGYITGSGFVNKSESFELIGQSNKAIQYGGVLTNEGVITQLGDSNLAFNSYNRRYDHRYDKSSIMNNKAGATYDLNGDGDILQGTHSEHVICSWPSSCNRIEGKAGQGKGAINNEGFFVKSSGDGESVVEAGIAFNNTGTVEVQSGTLTINSANGDGGQYSAKENTVLNLNGGNRDNSHYVYADNTSGVIRGNDHNANYTVGSNSQIDVGTGVNGTANFTGDGTLLINGIQGKSGTDTSLTGDIGEIIITGGLTTQSGGKISLDFDTALLLDGGSIGGSGETINNGELVWKSGYITGSGFVNKSDDFELTGESNKTIQYGGVLTNEGTISQLGDSNLAFNSYKYRSYLTSSIVNQKEAIYNLQGDGDLIQGSYTEVRSCSWYQSCSTRTRGYAGQGKGVFINEGLFIKSSGDGESVVQSGITFNNTGIVEVKSGTLNFQGSLVNDGTIKTNQNTTLIKNGTLVNNSLIENSGTLDLGSNGSINNSGTVNNKESGLIKFGKSSILAGALINNGLIDIKDNSVLTLTGDVSGSGTFAGSTFLKSTFVNPGNSPGTLTFDGDTTWENVTLNMEVAGFAIGEYDVININGNLDLLGLFTINFGFADGLDFDSLIGKSFDYLNVTGEQTGIAFTDWVVNLVDGWAANWVDDGVDGWRLALSYAGVANGQSPTDVPEPGTLLLMLLAVTGLAYHRKKYLVEK